MSDENLQNTTNYLVPDWYYDAFAMRVLGFKYREIAQKLKKHEVDVRKLFCRSGRMYPFWRQYVEVKRAEGIERAMDMMYASLPEILKTRIEHAKTFEPGAVESTKLILSQTIARDQDEPAPAVVINNTQINLIPEDKKHLIRSAFANFGILRQKNGQQQPTIDGSGAGGDIQQPGAAPGNGQ